MSDRRKIVERERKVAVPLFVALMMMDRRTGPLDRRGFYAFARELIPDLQPDVVDAALALAGQSSAEELGRFADAIADLPAPPASEPGASR